MGFPSTFWFPPTFILVTYLLLIIFDSYIVMTSSSKYPLSSKEIFKQILTIEIITFLITTVSPCYRHYYEFVILQGLTLQTLAMVALFILSFCILTIITFWIFIVYLDFLNALKK